MSWRYLYSKHIIGLPPVDGGECVRLVQHYIPEIDNTSTWERGESVITSLTLCRGMAIANFTKDGKWPGHPHNNHACMLWDWGGRNAATGEVAWIEIVEQFVGLTTISLRRLTRLGAGKNPSNNADEFYVIEHKGHPHETHTSRYGPPAHHHIGDKCPDRNEGEAVSDESRLRLVQWPEFSVSGVEIRG